VPLTPFSPPTKGKGSGADGLSLEPPPTKQFPENSNQTIEIRQQNDKSEDSKPQQGKRPLLSCCGPWNLIGVLSKSTCALLSHS
jgi:hypothetical protein